MSCILRISGETLDVDTLLSQNVLHPDQKWKKGEARFFKGQFYSDSGATFVVSEADLDEFDHQVEEATAFLELHAPIIASMTAFPGVQRAVLDFGVALSEGCVANFCYLPPPLIQLAARVGIGMEVSHYACSKDEES